MKKIALFVAITLIVFAATTPALAQYYPSYSTYSTQTNQCTNLTSNLYNGLTDSLSAGQVSILQYFLISRGYLTSVRIPTGQFGSRTAQAVTAYQMSHGIFGNGYVDATTRNAINSESCGTAYTGYTGYNNGYRNGSYYGGTTGYGSTGYYNNGYTYGNYYSAPTIRSLSLYTGSAGTAVTIYGTGFDLLNNTVSFNGAMEYGIPSYNGTALAFTVPQIYGSNYNNNYNNYYSTYNSNVIGTYPVTVTTSHGTSNSINFSLTSGNNNNCYNNYYGGVYMNGYYNPCYNYNLTPSLSSISPSSARVGTQVILYGSGFTPTGNTVHFGNGGMSNVSASNGGNSIYYTIPSYVSGCDITSGYGVACPLYAQSITPGSYPVYISNTYGQTSTIYFTVTSY